MTEQEIQEDKQKYTRKITAPIYEPKNTMPLVSEMFDSSKRDELVKEINNNKDLQGPENQELKQFLLLAAERHCAFNYTKIADYYAHLPFKYKTFFEKSGLVIIDYDNAIRNGFVQYAKEVDITRLEYLENELTQEKQKERINKVKLKQTQEEIDYINQSCDEDEEW